MYIGKESAGHLQWHLQPPFEPACSADTEPEPATTVTAEPVADIVEVPGAARVAVSTELKDGEEVACSAGIAFSLEPAMTVTWAPFIDVVVAPTRPASLRVAVFSGPMADEDDAACSAAIVLALDPTIRVNAGPAMVVVDAPMSPPSARDAVVVVSMDDGITSESATPAELDSATTVTALVSINVVVVVVVEVLIPPAYPGKMKDIELVVAPAAIVLLVELDE